jgi:hypothetical protein
MNSEIIDSKFQVLEAKIYDLESRVSVTGQQVAVLEARVPLQLEMIIKSIDTLTGEIRNDRQTQSAVNADVLTRIARLENRPSQDALEEVTRRREDWQHVVRAMVAEITRAIVLVAASMMGAQMLLHK